MLLWFREYTRLMGIGRTLPITIAMAIATMAGTTTVEMIMVETIMVETITGSR